MKKNKAIDKEIERYSKGMYIVLSVTSRSIMTKDTSTKTSKIPNILQQTQKSTGSEQRGVHLYGYTTSIGQRSDFKNAILWDETVQRYEELHCLRACRVAPCSPNRSRCQENSIPPDHLMLHWPLLRETWEWHSKTEPANGIKITCIHL